MLSVNSCVVCQKRNSYPICANCKKNPFKIEKCRQVLAVQGDIPTLKKLYTEKFPEIKDLNTSKFWDEKLKENETLSMQDGMTRDRINTVINFLPKKKIKLLDIGAGHGFLEEKLSTRNIDLYANDFSEESIKHLRKRFIGTFSMQSIYNLQYKADFFDVICILEVLEHIPPSKIFSVLHSVNQLLKSNGILIVSVPMNEGLEEMKNNLNGHVRIYTPELLSIELELSGFRVLEEQTLFAFRQYYFFKKIITKVFRSRWQPNNIIVKAIKK